MWTRTSRLGLGQGPPATQRGFAASTPCRLPGARPQLASCQRRTTTIAAARTHYDILGVEPTADATAIKSAFRKAAKLLHPDVSKSDDSEEDFIRVKEAYEILSDDRQRRAYDEQLRQAMRRRSSSSAASTSSRGRRSAASAAGFAAGTRVVVQDEHGNFVEMDVGDLFGAEFMMDDEDDSDDDDGFLDLDDDDDLDYVVWASTPGNFKSSFQASWQSNGRKQRRAKQQAASAEAPLSMDEKELLLRELPRQYRAAAQQMFGAHLQTLRNLDELAQLIEAVDEISAMGVQFEVMHDEFGNGVGSGNSSRGRRRTSTSSSSSGGGGGRRAGGGRGGAGRSSARSGGGVGGSGRGGRGRR